MKERLALALAAASLVAAMVPGVASAAPSLGNKTEICHFPAHAGLYFDVPVTDWYWRVGGTFSDEGVPEWVTDHCRNLGGHPIIVSNNALDRGHPVQGAPID